jgi:hypothetical protein
VRRRSALTCPSLHALSTPHAILLPHRLMPSRYVQWSCSTPTMIFTLSRISALTPPAIAATMLADWLMVVCGYAAAELPWLLAGEDPDTCRVRKLSHGVTRSYLALALLPRHGALETHCASCVCCMASGRQALCCAWPSWSRFLLARSVPAGAVLLLLCVRHDPAAPHPHRRVAGGGHTTRAALVRAPVRLLACWAIG